MTRLLPMLLLILVAASSQAQAASQFCQAGSRDASIAAKGDRENPIEMLKKSCRPGQIVSLPADADSVISRVCDFSKTMVHLDQGTKLQCVLSPSFADEP